MILLTGGTGRLGKELQKHLEVWAPTHDELDIMKEIVPDERINLIIHAAGYTDVAGAETNRGECYEVNVIGTLNLLRAYPTTPFIFISSEYVNHPVNVYAKSKLLGEIVVKQLAYRYLIIKTLFKERPFPYPMAFYDQYTKGDYVDIIGPMIAKEIEDWNQKDCRVIDVGTERKTIYSLAKKSRPTVRPGSVDEITSVVLPKDYL